MRPADWVVTRLHRMVTPAAALAGFWVVGLAIAAALGGFGVAAVGAAGAAIPLWFLANYTIDTALAPYTFRWFRERPAVLVAGLVGALRARRGGELRQRARARSAELDRRLARLPGGRVRLAAGSAPDRPAPGRARRLDVGGGDRRRAPRAVAVGDAPPRRTRAQPHPSAVDGPAAVRPRLLLHRGRLRSGGRPVPGSVDPGLAADDRRQRRGDVRVPLAHDRRRRRGRCRASAWA